MAASTLKDSAFPTDKTIEAGLDRLEIACLAMTACVAGCELLLWLLPALRSFAPPGWQRMVGNTAAGMLLAVLCIWLSGDRQRSSAAVRWIWITAAALLMLFGLLFLAEYRLGVSLGIDRLFSFGVPPSVTRFPGRPAPQTAVGFVFLGAGILLVRARWRAWSAVTDTFVALLLGYVLILFGGYLYGALALVGVDPSNLTSQQTLACFGLLTFVLVTRRARLGGPLQMLLRVGIGGQAVRVLLPGVFVFPFFVFGSVGYLIESGALPIPFARAFAATTAVLVGLSVVIWLTLRINALEGELREMALNDGLTGVLNRRGFDLLGEQALREARRLDRSVAVLFFDLDDLKGTNDRLGHHIGSQLIADVAGLLRGEFRSDDVVGRIGGDEFAVIMYGRDWESALERVNAATEALNRSGKRPYRISYSVGEALFDPKGAETFESLVGRADAKMYGAKLAKRHRAEVSERENGEAHRRSAGRLEYPHY
jgi:diguanylate cyclase (GGDEF)-like protein